MKVLKREPWWGIPLLLTICLLFVIGGCAAIYWGVSTITTIVSEEGWPSVDGTVQDVDIGEKGLEPLYLPLSYSRTLTVDYRYTVGATSYTGTDVLEDYDPQHTQVEYEEAESVLVYYNPDNPQESGLWVGLESGITAKLVVQPLLIMLAVMLGYSYIRFMWNILKEAMKPKANELENSFD